MAETTGSSLSDQTAFSLQRKFDRTKATPIPIFTPDGQTTTYFKWHGAWKSDRTIAKEYRPRLFSDELDGATLIAGGEAEAFAAGKVVVEFGSGEAVALMDYAQKYPDTIFVGIDKYYEETRPIDVTRPGVQLTHDDWTTLSSLEDGSVDTFIDVQAIFPWGIGPKGRPDSERIADAITKKAKVGAVLRFDIDAVPQQLNHRIYAKKLLEEKGWRIHYVTNIDKTLQRTMVAIKNGQPTK